jgi:hypothetical protein
MGDAFTIHASTLLMKIDGFEDAALAGLAPQASPQLTLIILELKKMAQWAIKHGYAEISGS